MGWLKFTVPTDGKFFESRLCLRLTTYGRVHIDALIQSF
jgi:hypothetical protein